MRLRFTVGDRTAGCIDHKFMPSGSFYCRLLVVRRTWIGPRAVEGFTTRPFCVISWVPALTSRRAAARAGSMSDRQFFGLIDRAASLGQMLRFCVLVWRSWVMAVWSSSSTVRTFCRRHRSEHHFICGQSRAHFLRQWMVRPHAWQIFSSWGIPHSRPPE